MSNDNHSDSSDNEQEQTFDFYGDLGIQNTATPDEIKRAYFKLARQYHPDQNPNDPTSTEKFQKIGKAYEILSNPEKKKYFDQTGTIEDSYFDKQDVNWEQYFEALYKRVSQEDIVNFQTSYKNSKEELEDLKKYYKEFKGDMEKIMEYVMLSTEDDYDRFQNTLEDLINKKELPKYKAFEKKVCRETRRKKQKEEEEELNSLQDLSNLIKQKQLVRSENLDILTKKLERKYQEKDRKRKRE